MIKVSRFFRTYVYFIWSVMDREKYCVVDSGIDDLGCVLSLLCTGSDCRARWQSALVDQDRFGEDDGF